MKYSLLDMTQSILNEMDSDAVNSIADTQESSDVALIVRDSYFYLIAKRDWAFLRTLEQLEGLSDTDNPTTMKMPETINKLLWVKYNDKEVCYLDPKDFHDMIKEREEQTDVVDSAGYGLNKDPEFWTTYDDINVVFDSRDSSIDATLQASKSTAYVVKVPEWTHEDEFVPELPDKFFPTLLSEATSASFVAKKQQPNAKAESKSKLGQADMHKEHWRNEKGEHKTNKAVNYGR